MTQPLCSARITRTQRYYGLLRPCAPPRYAHPHGANHLNFSLIIGTTGSHVPRKSLEQRHAIYTPDTTQPVDRLPLDSSRTTLLNPVLMSSLCFRCFSNGSCYSSHCSIHDAFVDAFSLTLTTTTLDRSSSGLFEASPCRAAPEDLPPSLSELRH